MAILDLPALVRARKRGKEVKVDMPSLPKSLEKELSKIYLSVVNQIAGVALQEVVEAYRQEVQTRDSIEASLSSIDQKTLQLLLTFAGDWSAWAERGTRIQFSLLAKKLKYATNIDLETLLGPTGILSSGGSINDLLQWNVELIRGLSEEMRQKIASSVYSGLTAKTPPREIAREIQKATGVARDRALRIASDQTLKLSSALDAQRLLDLGCEGYEWMHSGKLHPRIIHKERDGKFIKFGSEIDRTDPPGHAPFCGCKRRMVL